MKNSPPYQIEHGLSAERPLEVDRHLESIQDNERLLFLEDLRDTMGTMFEVHEKIRSCTHLNIETNLKFGGAHEIFEKGLYGWAEQVAEIAKRYVRKLAKIAQAQKPDWDIGDQAHWGRDCVAKFLDEWWLSSKPPRHTYGRIEVWFKYASDGHPDFDLSDSGWIDPWRAPAWSVRGCRKFREDDLSERLTPEKTGWFLSSRQRGIRDGWFKNALNAGEREAKSDLAMMIVPHSLGAVSGLGARRTHKKRASRQYRSALKRHIRNYLTNNPEATALQVCGYVDEQDVDDIPPSWLKKGNRELTVAYRNEEVRPLIDSMVSKVKRDLKA